MRHVPLRRPLSCAVAFGVIALAVSACGKKEEPAAPAPVPAPAPAVTPVEETTVSTAPQPPLVITGECLVRITEDTTETYYNFNSQSITTVTPGADPQTSAFTTLQAADDQRAVLQAYAYLPPAIARCPQPAFEQVAVPAAPTAPVAEPASAAAEVQSPAPVAAPAVTAPAASAPTP